MKFSFPCEVECGCYRLCWKRVNIFLNFSRNSFSHERNGEREKRRYGDVASASLPMSDWLEANATMPLLRLFADSPTSGITGYRRPLVTMLLLFRKGCDEKKRARESRELRERQIADRAADKLRKIRVDSRDSRAVLFRTSIFGFRICLPHAAIALPPASAKASGRQTGRHLYCRHRMPVSQVH
jgi:hypothetical protein